MKFLTVCGVVCGLVANAQVTPATPAFTTNVEMVVATDTVPTDCPEASGAFAFDKLQSCYNNAQSYSGIYTFAGQASAGVYTGKPCQNSDATGTYLTAETLVKYLPDWMKQAAPTGTYTLTLQKQTTKQCVVSFIVPTDQTGETCTAPVEGTKVGEDVTVPLGATSFTVQAADFAESNKIAVLATGCSAEEFGTALVSVDATQVKHPFAYTTEGNPEGASAHMILGSLLVLPLLANL
eukprot:Gregarina_sp_Pseudo_9__4441@NODE_459_length_2798_cov_517_964117_g435_i0_p2_GENE_NODE_459_length_2798_cov_517_964117_g435_i0NODE_459_length_2798_cov_517_964117_g435_i0_p2_ORF_typecomplete_len237_score40_99Peptidase_S78_2/PF14550_6/0_021DUF3506/PF12014_8/0_039FeldI_B/PF09252_10/0_23_NODE_459_length_2798_cov_517_964117_g435_i03121022